MPHARRRPAIPVRLPCRYPELGCGSLFLPTPPCSRPVERLEVLPLLPQNVFGPRSVTRLFRPSMQQTRPATRQPGPLDAGLWPVPVLHPHAEVPLCGTVLVPRLQPHVHLIAAQGFDRATARDRLWRSTPLANRRGGHEFGLHHPHPTRHSPPAQGSAGVPTTMAILRITSACPRHGSPCNPTSPKRCPTVHGSSWAFAPLPARLAWPQNSAQDTPI